MSYIFNPFIENLDKISGVISGIQFVGLIRNANLNPGYPTSTPEVNQAWIVADNPGTVGGQPVDIGDIVIYTSSGWEIIQDGTFAIPIATEIVYGKVRIATIDEVKEGSIDDAAVTPLKLFNYLQSTDFGQALIPQLLNKLISDGSVTITDSTNTITLSLPILIQSGIYGSQGETLIINTDDRGRIIGITSTPIVIEASQITDLTTFITNNFSTIITSNTLDVNDGNIELPSVITPGTYGNDTNFPVITVDQYGRVISITTTSITGNPNFTKDVQDIIGNSLNSTTLNISYDSNSGYTTIEIPDTSVSPGTYGSSSQVASFTVNSQGRLVSAGNVNINISSSQISDFANGVKNLLSNSLGNTSNVTLTWNPTSSQILADLTNLGTPGTYGSGDKIPVITVDTKGRITNIGLVDINWSLGSFTSSQITDFTEAAQDAVASALTDSSEIDFVYDDNLNQITALLQPSGVTAGTYTKVTVDSKGRVTSATFLSSSDLPAHTHDGSHIVSGIIDVARLGINPQPDTFLRGDGQFATVTPTFGNQTPNTVFAGPATAPSSQPVFRALVNQDLPLSGVVAGTYGSSTSIPVITVNDRGIITTITTNPLSSPSLTWGNITGSITSQTDLMNLLNDYQLRSEKGQPDGYASLDSSGRLPSSQLTIHSHGVGDISGLSALLNQKADLNHTHTSLDITDFEEAVQDVVGNTLVAGQGIGITYNDAANQILIENTQTVLSAEDVQDIAAGLFTSGNHDGIVFNYDDANNRINTSVTIDLQKVTDNGYTTSNHIHVLQHPNNSFLSHESLTILNLSTDKKVKLSNQNLIFSNLNDTQYIELVFNYTAPRTQVFQDSSGTIALLSDIPSSVSSFSDFNESVDDRVAQLLQAGTGISLTYNDSANTLTISTDGVILQNGNSFGQPVRIGTNDNQNLIFETNNTDRLIISDSGTVTINNLSGTGTRIVQVDSSGNLQSGILTSSILQSSRQITINGQTFDLSSDRTWDVGTVTEINTGTGLSGGPITSTGTISLTDTGVIPGSYTNANITVDAQGRITAASNGSSSGITLNQGKLAGRGATSGTGSIEEITLGTGLVMTGTTLSVSSEPINGTITPGMPLDLNTSFNDYVASINISSYSYANVFTGGYGIFSAPAEYIGPSVPNPINAVGVQRSLILNSSSSTWYGLIYRYIPFFAGYLSEKRNFFILKRRMRLESFPDNTSYFYGIISRTHHLSNVTDLPYSGVFFRWETNNSGVVNFTTHVREVNLSTISIPTYQPPNWEDWFVLEIRIGPLGIQFFVDGIAVTGHINTNIPHIDTYNDGDIYGCIGYTDNNSEAYLEVDWDYARPNV